MKGNDNDNIRFAEISYVVLDNLKNNNDFAINYIGSDITINLGWPYKPLSIINRKLNAKEFVVKKNNSDEYELYFVFFKKDLAGQFNNDFVEDAWLLPSDKILDFFINIERQKYTPQLSKSIHDHIVANIDMNWENKLLELYKKKNNKNNNQLKNEKLSANNNINSNNNLNNDIPNENKEIKNENNNIDENNNINNNNINESINENEDNKEDEDENENSIDSQIIGRKNSNQLKTENDKPINENEKLNTNNINSNNNLNNDIPNENKEIKNENSEEENNEYNNLNDNINSDNNNKELQKKPKRKNTVSLFGLNGCYKITKEEQSNHTCDCCFW